MQLRALGKSGLQVSRLALGTLTWGRDTDENEARDQLKAFIQAGGNLIDTANIYNEGVSERLLGQLIAEEDLRDQIVIATKSASRPGTQRRYDASRKHILESLDHSLRRLGVDTIDLWQLHAWDPFTPIEETLSAVDAAVAAGKVRYVGISNYSGWQTALAANHQHADRSSAPLVSTQVEYSLVQRGIEREVIPAADALGMGVLAWSPLGRGVLTGKYRNATPTESRGSNPAYAKFVQTYLTPEAGHIVDAVCTAAEGLDTQPAQVALAWVRDRPGVTSAIVGARTTTQLNVALASEELELPTALVDALNDVSEPASGYPDSGWNQRSS